MACQGKLYGTPLTLQASYEQQRGQCRRPQTTLPKALYLVYNIECELYMCAKSYATKLHQLLKVWVRHGPHTHQGKSKVFSKLQIQKIGQQFSRSIKLFRRPEGRGCITDFKESLLRSIVSFQLDRAAGRHSQAPSTAVKPKKCLLPRQPLKKTSAKISPSLWINCHGCIKIAADSVINHLVWLRPQAITWKLPVVHSRSPRHPHFGQLCLKPAGGSGT